MNDPSDISKASVSSTPKTITLSTGDSRRIIMKVAGVILIAVLAFCLGMYYGDHHTKQNPTSTNGGFGFRRGGGLGTVSAISASNITVANSRTGTSTSYSINSATKVTDNGQTSSVGAITDGETVIVFPSSSSSSTAASIVLNPSFGGFGGNTAPSPGSTTTGSATTN